MNFKRTILFLFVALFGHSIYAQEDADKIPANRYNPKDPEVGFFSVSLSQPIAFGNNSLNKGYKVHPQASLGFSWFVLPSVTLGAFFDFGLAEVSDISQVGNIERTGIFREGIELGYYRTINREWNLHFTAGVSHLLHKSSLPAGGDKFREQGVSYKLEAELGYRFNQTFGAFFTLGYYLDTLNIGSPPGMDKFFNRQNMLNFGVGLRLNLHNPNG